MKAMMNTTMPHKPAETTGMFKELASGLGTWFPDQRQGKRTVAGELLGTMLLSSVPCIILSLKSFKSANALSSFFIQRWPDLKVLSVKGSH